MSRVDRCQTFRLQQPQTRPVKHDEQHILESNVIDITKPNDELVIGDIEVNSVDDWFVDVIGGEIVEGIAEDTEIDIPRQCKRWKARIAKQEKVKKAAVYFFKLQC